MSKRTAVSKKTEGRPFLRLVSTVFSQTDRMDAWAVNMEAEPGHLQLESS